MRSKFERQVAKQLRDAGISYRYEPEQWLYRFRPRRSDFLCEECGSRQIAKERYYTPDFVLENGIVIEAKGKMPASERTKLIAIKDSWPDVDLRLLFMRDNRLTRRSRTYYSEWAEKHGFIWAVETIPAAWLRKRL